MTATIPREQPAGQPPAEVAEGVGSVRWSPGSAGTGQPGSDRAASARDRVLALRSVAKGVVERIVVASGVERLGRWVRPGRAMVLAYHNVVPDELAGTGDSSLHLPLSEFSRQLDVISRECHPLSLTDVLNGTWDSPAGRLAVIITFDDAYRGALTLAVPELAERGLTSTVFVAPALLGDRTLWWDGLASSVGKEPAANLRSRIQEIGVDGIKEAKNVGAGMGASWHEMPEMLRTCTEGELASVVADGVCTVGSHTWSHASLTHLADGDMTNELVRSRDWLRDQFGKAYVDAVSYPFGNWSPAVEKMVETCGYRGALALTKGSIRPGSPNGRFRMPRMNVPAGLSQAGLRIRLGWR